MILIEDVTHGLPGGLDTLRAEAFAEGFRFVERLADGWASGEARFDQEGEFLQAARVDGVLAGIGGVTRDPIVPGALRMRRFYVRPGFRRNGIGRALARRLLDKAVCSRRPITVNAGTPDAPAFWEALGFEPDPRDGHTHVKR